MISKLARRFGFQQSVPVALIDDWVTPVADLPLVELAPREGAASCLVDQYGRVQVADATWCLDLTLAAGARWVPAGTSQKVKQQLLAPSVLETVIETPSGPVVQRVAVGVVDAKPVAIIEVENTGGVAIAVGLVARPLRHDGRGHIAETAVGPDAVAINGERVVRFDSSPAAVKVATGAQGDLLQAMPDPSAGSRSAATRCRSGAAQAAAVWPLPHTATLRVIVELGDETAPGAAVPSTADVNRGWHAHLEQGVRVEVDGLNIDRDVAVAARSLLTLWPEPDEAGATVVALSELGFARDAARSFRALERCEDDAHVVRSLARWAQLGEAMHQLDDLDAILGRVGRAAHVVAHSGQPLVGPSWLESALVALGGRLHQIEQPDVADRVQAFATTTTARRDAAADLDELAGALTDRGVWPERQLYSAAQLIRATRSIVVDDAGGEVRLLPVVPVSWRGRAIDVFGLPVAGGKVSFGLRWHGARPAIFWEAALAPEAPLQISVPGIDGGFVSNEREGEALLADPGWQRS